MMEYLIIAIAVFGGFLIGVGFAVVWGLWLIRNEDY
jgi:hypothetical protein